LFRRFRGIYYLGQHMNHLLSAGAIVENDERFLLVRHRLLGRYDFWVAPGGGVKGTESLEQAAEREVKEETGLFVQVERLLCIEEFFNPEQRHCKFWFAAKLVGGTLDATAPEAIAEHITQAAWLPAKALHEVEVFPPYLKHDYHAHKQQGFQQILRYPLRQMSFW
jgi:8-oxo-dGTP diphosphatase